MYTYTLYTYIHPLPQKSCCFQYVEREDSALCSHITSLSDGIPFTLYACTRTYYDHLIPTVYICSIHTSLLSRASLLLFLLSWLISFTLYVTYIVHVHVPTYNISFFFTFFFCFPPPRVAVGSISVLLPFCQSTVWSVCGID